MRVWIVSPDSSLEAFSGFLKRHNQEVVGSTSILNQILQILPEIQADVLLINRYTPGTVTVAGVLWQVRAKRPDLRVVLILGEDDKDAKGIKAAAVSAGVYDWHTGRSINSSIIDMIEKPHTFSDVAGEVPVEEVQDAAPAAPELEPSPKEEQPVKSGRFSRLRLPSVSRLPKAPARPRQRDRRVAVPHLLYGVLSPSPSAVFRGVQAMGEAWTAAGGDAAAVSLDLLTDPWPAGPFGDLSAYTTKRGSLQWFSFGTVLTQDTLPMLDEMRDDSKLAENVAQRVRGVYRRRASGSAATLLALGNPWLDPLARSAMSLPDVVLLAVETPEDYRICAQWYALMQSLEWLPSRTVSLVSRDGRAVTDEVWDVRGGWDAIISRLMAINLGGEEHGA